MTTCLPPVGKPVGRVGRYKNANTKYLKTKHEDFVFLRRVRYI